MGRPLHRPDHGLSHNLPYGRALRIREENLLPELSEINFPRRTFGETTDGHFEDGRQLVVGQLRRQVLIQRQALGRIL